MGNEPEIIPGYSESDLSSLDLVLEEVREETAVQRHQWVAQDTKGGVVIGLAAAAVAASATLRSLWMVPGQALSALSGLWALSALLPRDQPILQVDVMRDRHITENPIRARLILLDVRLEHWEETNNLLTKKALRLRHSMQILAGSLVLLFIGAVLVNFIEGG